MRTVNVFRLIKGRIEYTEAIKAAVLNPRITGLKLNLNGGWDWIDCKYGFIKLLLSRGQVAELTTHSDLLARQDYLDTFAAAGRVVSVNFDCVNAPVFGTPMPKSRQSWASEKRMRAAQQKFQSYLMVSASAVQS